MRGHDGNHFCTPKGAKVIGWAGVDGIHYCFVRGFGEMVFAVSPMNTPGTMYIRWQEILWTSCGSCWLAAMLPALEQVYCWD
jgi:hypothetical protein